MFRNILTGIAALALVAGAAAQTQVTVKSKINVPVKYFGTYKMATGEWSYGGVRLGPRVIYNSTSPGNYYSAVGNASQPAADQEWIDEGEVADENAAQVGQINGFDFAYCSTDLEPLGNQCAVGINFYDDYIPCSTPLSAATCAYTIVGLPCSISGNTECWGVSVDLMGGAECTADPANMFRTKGAVTNPLGNVNGNFGWGFVSNPGVAGLNDTGPILSFPCPNPGVGCSSGSIQGNQNFFWWEDPTAVWTGCYWFGGVPFASFEMKMHSSAVGSYAYYGTNVNTLAADTTDFIRGANVTWNVTGGSGGQMYLLAGTATNSFALAVGELLVSLPFVPPTPVPFPGLGATSLSVTVPGNAPTVYTQVGETSGPPTPGAALALSNGLYHPL